MTDIFTNAHKEDPWDYAAKTLSERADFAKIRTMTTEQRNAAVTILLICYFNTIKFYRQKMQTDPDDDNAHDCLWSWAVTFLNNWLWPRDLLPEVKQTLSSMIEFCLEVVEDHNEKGPTIPQIISKKLRKGQRLWNQEIQWIENEGKRLRPGAPLPKVKKGRPKMDHWERTRRDFNIIRVFDKLFCEEAEVYEEAVRKTARECLVSEREVKYALKRREF